MLVLDKNTAGIVSYHANVDKDPGTQSPFRIYSSAKAETLKCPLRNIRLLVAQTAYFRALICLIIVAVPF
jgi:hypothetical protein